VLDAEKLATQGELMPMRIDEVDVRGCFTEVQTMVKLLAKTGVAVSSSVAPNVVGLCMLNQVDPYPITYSLSNP
jgi:hypothetical protein